MLIRPDRRWKPNGRPGYAGLLTFAGLPYSEDPVDLEGVDVAIVGAPMDELVSERPGTRFAPRAIRAAGSPHGPSVDAARIDGLSELVVVDFGDAPCVPAAPQQSHAAIRTLVQLVCSRGVVPIVIGGDHSIAEPSVSGCAEIHGPLGLVQLDAHTDTADDVFGVRLSHGTGMRRLVERGVVEGANYIQVGLRGYWPGPAEFQWQRGHGITSIDMECLRARGCASVIDEISKMLGDAPTYLSVDMDVVDPAFAPGVGDPQPGGMTSTELLYACRAFGEGLNLVGADVVEAIPSGIGQADATAVLAERAIREVINGIALRRRNGTEAS